MTKYTPDKLASSVIQIIVMKSVSLQEFRDKYGIQTKTLHVCFLNPSFLDSFT